MKPLFTISCFAASALAADCSGPTQEIPSELLHLYWDARTQMCSNTRCALGKDCTVEAGANVNNRAMSVIIQRRKNGVKGFKDCYVSNLTRRLAESFYIY